MKTIDTVGHWMTRSPQTLASHDTVDDAYEVFRAHGFRHMPVVDAGKLVGMVSERDLFVAAKFAVTHAVKLEVIMTLDPYKVGPGVSIGEVAAAMLTLRHEAAVVVDEGRVVGVFTTVDALRFIAGRAVEISTPLPVPADVGPMMMRSGQVESALPTTQGTVPTPRS